MMKIGDCKIGDQVIIDGAEYIVSNVQRGFCDIIDEKGHEWRCMPTLKVRKVITK
jgi:hypothetical protein